MTFEPDQNEGYWRDIWAHSALHGYGLGRVLGSVEGSYAKFEAFMEEVDRVGVRQAKENWLKRLGKTEGGTDTQQGDSGHDT